MHSRKKLRPRMEPWGTSELTGHSCKDLLTRTGRGWLSLRNVEIRL